MTTARTQTILPETQRGPAERLLDVVLGGSAHLWHHRPGLDVNGTWVAAAGADAKALSRGRKVAPGLFVPAAVKLYGQLLELHRLNPTLMAHFASYALTQTDWRDLKVATCALMLVQEHAGQPVRDGQGAVAFHDDDYRAIGEAMVLHYVRRSTRMLTPKAVLRVAELLETPEIARLNRAAGFGDPASRKPPLGRWKRVAQKWLAAREANLPMLQGLVKAGYKETLKKLARKAGYKPQSQGFFEVLGWKQKQADGGHRQVGLQGLVLVKRERFDGLSEAEICEWIELERLSYKEVVGRLPKDVGLTPAILATLLPSLSDRDLRLMTPTLEDLGLLQEPSVKARWERAVANSTDQRSLNIAKNVRSEDVRRKLEEASDNAVKKAVAEATAETDVRVMFLIDKSGSMEGAIEQSKEALSRILAGFPMDKLHVAAFDTMGTVLKPKAPNRTAVQHMLSGLKASGGTVHAAGVHALHRDGVRIPAEAKLVVMVVGDEAGEAGDQFAKAFHACGYSVAALALLVSVAGARGSTVRSGAKQLGVPFSEVSVGQFADPYQVPRVLQALMDAPREAGASQSGWVDRVMSTPLLKAA
ncbi:VWA domain-containing protein [Corallococcus carmarthensis]|uniref:VWA domain-containing protein n=1 Tax=Corallococcus carmarthensis TaxID=2316728 RepID=A0A3A8L0I0_9BACT|nr:VWA domain-containing protein [Corallococcus carmarthensis]RKH07744.1 VWA domain-containing protein [Corallococcus carmarthensis]